MVQKVLGHLRKLAVVAAVGAAALTWADTLKWSWASSEWTGLWSSSTELRGNTVKIEAKDVETTAEREKREKQLDTGVIDDLRGVKRDVMGDKRALRGKDVNGGSAELPPGYGDYTQRDACMQQKLEFPERFKDLDCMSDKYDDTESWLKAPTHPGGAP